MIGGEKDYNEYPLDQGPVAFIDLNDKNI